MTTEGMCRIGDFGISKVLEATYDVASTMVGTPYYMRYFSLLVFNFSPEVCESKPYTYKSDI